MTYRHEGVNIRVVRETTYTDFTRIANRSIVGKLIQMTTTYIQHTALRLRRERERPRIYNLTLINWPAAVA